MIELCFNKSKVHTRSNLNCELYSNFSNQYFIYELKKIDLKWYNKMLNITYEFHKKKTLHLKFSNIYLMLDLYTYQTNPRKQKKIQLWINSKQFIR